MARSCTVEESGIIEEPLLSSRPNPKGGLRTLPFIIANEAFERLSNYGLQPDMVLYLTQEYGLSAAGAANITYLWSAATDFFPIVGAFTADSYLGRYLTICIGCIICLLGTTLLWLTTLFPQIRPFCSQLSDTCEHPTTPQLLLLCSSFGLMAIGAGGIRSCSPAFGTDQLEKKKDPRNARLLESFFTWYNISINVAVVIALTCVVYIQENMGWKLGFGIPALLMLLSAISFFLATPFYTMVKPKGSVLNGLAQVVVASFKNRDIELSSLDTYEYYHIKGKILQRPSDKLRFLNRACIIRNSQQNLTIDGRISDPWSLCTVNQVEDLKALIRTLPIWASGVFTSLTVTQSIFPVLQASSMNRHIIFNFEIPAGSFSIFIVISMTMWLFLYDRVILPVSSKLMGRSVRLSSKLRMGIGVFVSIISLLTAALVENIRRNRAIEEGVADDPKAMINMSAMWLAPQFIFLGITEAFNTIGQIEFFYSESPKYMVSIALTLVTLGRSLGSVLASVLLSGVDAITSKGNHYSWVSTNLNKGHYSYFCLLLAALGVVNFFFYIACSRAYGPLKGEGKDFMEIVAGHDDDDDDDDDEDGEDGDDVDH